MKKQFIGLKETVVVVLFSVLTVVIGMLTQIPFMMSPKLSVLAGYTLSALIGGAVYVLMIAKSPVRGTNLLFFAVKAIYVAVLGQMPTAIVYLIGGVICEAITWKAGTKELVPATISYSVHNVIFGIGSFTPMILAADSYAQQMLDMGMSEEIVNSMIYDLVAPSFMLIAGVLITLGSVAGMFVGAKMMKKHFAPAGVA